MEQAEGSWSDWLADRSLRTVIGAARCLPYESRVRSFGKLVEQGIAPMIGYRKRAEEQLSLIYPERSDEWRQRTAARVCNNFGRTFIENYSPAGFAKAVERSVVSGEGLAHLKAANGRPVLFITGHFGNHEAPRMALTQRGYRIGGLYRPMSNPYVEAHYKQTMLSMSGDVFAQGRRGTMQFVRMLRDGGMGTLLFDVRATAFPRMDFLGHPAHTATSAADIALKLEALVIPYFATRTADGVTFDIAIEAPVPLTDQATMMREMTARLETRIRANPEQWFWVHRRWN
ncbi:lauroyl acyltransferase [Aliishimia ponticola]|uniref:Lauroyl acyltransferase n=1 Tax=Aliishimia ponticola TaxID=2499833 RepID=A0A4S4NBF1_9RHOB|nr:lauroyl acyltransferase [Aliishimia ponticola]THH36734.1 lauroyl acyltransferase [Aliishimia ponticola]